MDAAVFLDNFDVIAEAPGGIARLREMILRLAVRGQLVPPDTRDEPVNRLLTRLAAVREPRSPRAVAGGSRFPVGVAVTKPPYQIPAHWIWVRLADVGAIVGGGTPRTNTASYWSDTPAIPWLTPADMRTQASRYIERGARDITREGLAHSSAQLLPEHTVLFSSRAPIGHVGIAANPIATNQGFKSCVPYEPAMAEYIYYFLKSAGPEIEAQATGTTFKEVSGRDVALIPFPLPPPGEQIRIVSKVDELMALCDDLEAGQQTRYQVTNGLRSSALDALTTADIEPEVTAAWQRVHNNWDAIAADPGGVDRLREMILGLGVRGRLVSQNPEDEPGLDLLKRVRQERERQRGQQPPPKEVLPRPPFPLPESWAWSTLSEVAETQTGTTPDKNTSGESGTQIAYVRPAQINTLTVDESHLIARAAAEATGRIAAGGSVLFVGIGSIGKCGLTSSDTTFNQQIHAATPILLDPAFVAIALASPWFQTEASSRASSTTLRILNKTKWASIPLPIPPLSEQTRIAEAVNSLLLLCDTLKGALERQGAVGEALAQSAANHLLGEG